MPFNKPIFVLFLSHGESPKEVKEFFVNLVEKFVRENPTELIGVHCTHGFNRTGFLICCYMIEKLDYSVDMAVALFAQARPPGIYKQDYLNDLVKMYVKDDERDSIQVMAQIFSLVPLNLSLV